MMAGIQRVFEERSFADLDEAGAFLNSPAGRRAVEASPPATSLGRAQKLAYDAWEADGPRRYQLARQALAADPRCGDAWLILAEEERSWRKQWRCFERAVAAAERAAREEGWLDGPDGEAGGEGETDDEPVGLYRRHVGLRAYIRARVALARCLFVGERLWLALAEGEGGKGVAALARRAVKANPHVPDHLLGRADGGSGPPVRDARRTKLRRGLRRRLGLRGTAGDPRRPRAPGARGQGALAPEQGRFPLDPEAFDAAAVNEELRLTSHL